MKRRMPHLRHAAAAAFLAAALGACGGPSTPAEARAAHAASGTGDIVLGVVYPWSARGEIRFGEGIDLAVDEVNAAGGVRGRKLRIRREDDLESVNEGLLVAQRLAADPEVAAVIGHLQSYVTVPAASVYDLGGLLLVAPTSTDPGLTEKGYRRVFRTIFTDQETGRQMADYAADRGYRRVAIYYVRNGYGRALANAFEERASGAGLTIAARASYDAGHDLDVRALEPTLRQWKQLDLDAVFLAGQVPLAGRLVAEMRRGGLSVPVLGSDAMSGSGLVSEGGEAVEGIVVPAPFTASDPRPEVRTFGRAFRQRYGSDPDPGAAQGYDAVRLLAHAMERAGSTAPDSVAAFLHAMESWAGVSGPVAFDDHGDLRSRPAVKLVVRGGSFAPLPTEGGAP